MYCHWRNIIKHLFNVNTTSYNEKLFTMCCFQIGCFYIVYRPGTCLQPEAAVQLHALLTLDGSPRSLEVQGLSTYILLSNYGSAGTPPKSSMTQRLWQSHIYKMRRLGFLQ